MIELAVAGVRALVDDELGGRVASLRFDGFEVLVPGGTADHPSMWGCFPLVPWAGRVADGRFRHEGVQHRLVSNLGPHAIHGVGYQLPWTVGAEPSTTSVSLSLDLSEGAARTGWPFGGVARQRLTVRGDGLELELSVSAPPDRPMPAQVGWHPWFRKPEELSFVAGALYRRGPAGVPDGTLLRPPPPGPWDDCFTELEAFPQLHWSDGPALAVEHDCAYLVVYDEPAGATCVEPQSGPPDGFNLAPEVVPAGGELRRRMVLRRL